MGNRQGVCAIILVVIAARGWAAQPNLLPNGDAESEFVHLLHRDEGYASHIQAKDTGVPSFWRVTDGVTLIRGDVYAGEGAIRLDTAGSPVSATVFSDYWRVKDPAMPFGLPLPAGDPVMLSFAYKTASNMPPGAFSAKLTLGVIPGLPSISREIPLHASADWTEVSFILTPAELLWGAEVTFSLTGGAAQTAWVDAVHLAQDMGDPLNLVRNSSFEASAPQEGWPADWRPPVEDEWVSWVGSRYRPPTRDSAAAVSGRHSVRASVTYAEVSGLSQEVWLGQDGPRPIVVSLWSKLDHSIGNRPPGYYGSDNLPNLTVYVYHRDGSMQEVSPTFSLGESDHSWAYFRGGFLTQKPVEKIRLQVTVLGSEGTTSLWIDDVSVHELAGGVANSLASARVAPPRVLTAQWGALEQIASPYITAANDGANLCLSIPRSAEDRAVSIYLNLDSAADFMNYRRFYYDVVRVSPSGAIELGHAAEKQGYMASGRFEDGAAAGLSLDIPRENYHVTIPWRALRLDGPPQTPLGFNVEWDTSRGPVYWTGVAINREQLGSLIPARAPGIEIRALRFGDRWTREPDQSQDFVTHPPIYAGMNTAELTLFNAGPPLNVALEAGVTGMPPYTEDLALPAAQPTAIVFPYDAGMGPRIDDFLITLRAGGRDVLRTRYPLEIPAPIEIVLDQEFYFPGEPEARIEIHRRARPIHPGDIYVVELRDAASGKTIHRARYRASEAVTMLTVPIGDLRINDLPVQDYRAEVLLRNGRGKTLGAASARFGRIRHTVRRPLPPIKTLNIDETGRLVINGDFRFFPIVPSLSSDEYEEALELGANVHRMYYRLGAAADSDSPTIFERVQQTWERNAYTLTIGPGPGALDGIEGELERLLAHPGFLGCYARQFYYWRLRPEDQRYRDQVESLFMTAPTRRLLIWGHHDSSFLYDIERGDWPPPGLAGGYCYTKIMGRPGPAWRNAPFLTLTERVLAPGRFRLGEVNYYVSWKDDEIVPEHFKTYRSLRADDWRGVRSESYLAVICGAHGLYHYICTQKGGLQRLRGWFQELNHMWPIFAADDAPNGMTISPADSPVEARLKQWEGKLYLLTANASESAQQAAITVEGAGSMSARKLFDLPGAMTQAGSVIRDVWRKYDAFVYEIDATQSR